jgi:hypothetical protein
VWGGRREALPPCPHVGPHHRLVARSKARCALIYVDVGAYLGSLESARGVEWKEGGKEAPLPCPHVGPHHRLVAWSEARCALIYVDVGSYLGSLESARGLGWKEGGMKLDEGAAALSACVGLHSRGRETFMHGGLMSWLSYVLCFYLSLTIH